MKFKSRPLIVWRHLFRIDVLLLLLLSVGLAIVIRSGLLVTTGAIGIVLISICAAGRSAVLELKDNELEFKNRFIRATMLKSDLERVKIRGNRIFGRELMLFGSCVVHINGLGIHKRRSILIGDLFESSLEEILAAFENWRGKRS